MNEQIRGLAEQAADYANTYSDAGADVWFEIYNKKFAELIVAECTKILADNNEFRGCVIISKHFGVEK